jgi:hypothetical protein
MSGSSRKTALRPDFAGGILAREHELSKARALGATVAISFSANTTAVARHNLGRRYESGRILAQTTDGTSVGVNVCSPSVCEAAGYDPRVWIYCRASANNSLTFDVEVF